MRNIHILLFFWAFTLVCHAAIKPDAPRKGLAPQEARPAPPPKPAPAPAVAAPIPAAPQKVDPLTPSPSLLKDLAVIAQIHTNPAQARQTLTGCENLRNPLAIYPAHFQKLNFYWAVALANSGDHSAASEKFAIASALTAPDQTIAARALNSQISFCLRDPNHVDRAVALVKIAIGRSAENSPEQLNARFQGACALYILDEPNQARIALITIESARCTAKSGDPAIEELKKNTSYLLSAIHAAETAKNPQSAAHVFYPPWRGQEIRFGLGVNRRIADLAFNLRDFPHATELYTALEKEADVKGQAEIQAWCHMQRGRIHFIIGQPQESEKLLSPFLSSSPFKDADCAPFALLRLGLLYHNCLRDYPKAEKVFDFAAARFKDSQEGNQCQYYRAMMPMLANQPKAALPLLITYAKDHPKQPQSDYLATKLIPAIEAQLAKAQIH